MSYVDSNKKNWYCCIEGCTHYFENGISLQSPPKSCQNCNRFYICSKIDEKHDSILLFHEGCTQTCVYCALEAFQNKEYKNYEPGEEHCYCPLCSHDFGRLKDIPNTEKYVKNLEKIAEECSCSIDGCVPIQYSRYELEYELENQDVYYTSAYGSCNHCEEFTICPRGSNEPEHSAALLYNEGCREHEYGGYSICLNCAVKAYKDKLDKINEVCEDGQEHCICPECEYDFGLLQDLQSKF